MDKDGMTIHRATLRELNEHSYTSHQQPAGLRCETCGELFERVYSQGEGPLLCRDHFIAWVWERRKAVVTYGKA